MAINKKEITNFVGGISPFQKMGIANSFRWSANTNLHQDPNYITLMPSPAKVSGSVAIDLGKWMKDCSPFSTDRYAYGDAGNIYKITSAESWSLDRATATIGNGAAGQGLEVFDDFLYYATSTTIGRLGKLSGTPSYNDDFLSDGTTNIDQSSTTTGQTYNTTTSITETSVNMRSFVPTTDPIKAVHISVNTKGSGNWTVTLHDSSNNSLGSVTILAASMTTGYVTFTFSTPIRLTIGNTYHFHITTSVADGKVDTSTASDLSTGAYKTVYGILIADTNFHPILEFLNMIVIGNESYLATWNRAVYKPNRISLRAGYKVRSLTRFNEFIVAVAYKGADVTSCEDARMYFWDGKSTSFNFSVPISMGFPQFIHNKFNKLVGMYGSSASLNLGSMPFQQVQDIPTLTPTKYVEIYAGAVTEWQTKTYIGVAGASDDTALIKGVYEYGSLNQQFADVLNYAFTPSTGTKTGTGLKIGCVFGVGDSLYFSWKDGTSYGWDKVTKSGNAFTSGSWESLIFDNDSTLKEKNALKIGFRCEPLKTGESVTLKYRIDRATNFTSGSAFSTVGATTGRMDIVKRFHEIEWGFDFASSSGTFPKILSVYFEFDDLREEVYSG